MYLRITAAVLVLAALTGAQPVDERTIGNVAQMLGGQGPYPPSQAPYPAAAAQSYAQYWDQQPAHVPQGFTVQSGYEGIIAPTGPAPEGASALQKLGGVALGAGILSHLLPFPFNKLLWVFGSKLGLFVAGFVLLVLIGGATTTAVCALTPLCTISFLGLRLNKENVRSLLTQDRLDSITQFVHDAFDKYQQIQAREGKAFVNRPENKGKKPKHAKENKEEVKESREKKEEKESKEIQEATTESEVETVEVSREAKELNEEEVKDIKESNEVTKEEVQK